MFMVESEIGMVVVSAQKWYTHNFLSFKGTVVSWNFGDGYESEQVLVCCVLLYFCS